MAEPSPQLYEISATKYMLGTQIDFKAMFIIGKDWQKHTWQDHSIQSIIVDAAGTIFADSTIQTEYAFLLTK